jgi:ATP-dependent helicase HrpA
MMVEMSASDFTPEFRRLDSQIGRAMRADRFRLRKRLRAIKKATGGGKSSDRQLAQLGEAIERSVELRKARLTGVPRVLYDDGLPVAARRGEIADEIRQHQVVVVCGETGSGKSTQLPKICLELGWGIDGMIGHTQPRRIAARSIATRVADELGTPLGKGVGFKIRFTDTTSPETYVKVMTDGILLAETQGDRFLDQYDTIILDEAHERSLNVDFLLGYLKRLLPKRPDLKLIITSATLDAVRFSEHFASDGKPAPVIEVSGRTYPVEVRYRPMVIDEEGEEPELNDAVLAAVDELARIDTGDILIFMPTERHIHETAKALRGRAIPGDYPDRKTEVLPLYARLPAKEQQRVFRLHPHRRIVIATNVAESSLTVPGVRYVIDPGTARVSRYSPRTKTQRLPIESISQASADQRKGRCGRVAPGVCIRLFSEQDFLARDRYTMPEIQRTNLASVILQTKALRLGDVERFPFLDPPRRDWIRDGYKTLFEIGALDEHQRLTEIGRRLSSLPTDPRIGRMILAGDEEKCLTEILIIASALEIQDPRERPLDKQEAADEAHAQFADEQSDFLTYLRLWDFYQRLKEKLSRNQLRKACWQNFLSHNRMREWFDIHRQLRELVQEAGLRPKRRHDEYGPIHRAILTGLLSNVAFRSQTYEYTAAGGSKFHLWPGSSVFRTRPSWIVAGEMLETAKRYLRTCAPIDPAWIEPLAGHLVKRSYSEPHWDRKGASALAYEKVSLFGLPVVPRRRVPYGPIDPEASRALLIQHGLVEGELDTKAEFFAHNRTLFEECEALEAKTRRHDLLLGQWARFDFYDCRIPASVCDGKRLERWRRNEERTNPRVLFMSQADLLREQVDDAVQARFPDALPSDEAELPLDYRFEPGTECDGVTVTVPLEALGHLDPQRLGWLVPGLLEDRIVALIKSLPKPIRRRLVPAPDTAKEVLRQIRFGEGDMPAAVARQLSRIAGEAVSPEMFNEDKLPDNLRMNVRVVGTDRNTLAEGRDLAAVREKLGVKVAETFAALDDPQWKRDGLCSWDFDELPEEVRLNRGGMTVAAYPMVIDRGDCVSLRLASSPEKAAHESRAGLRRLFFIAADRELRSQIAWFPNLDSLLLHAATIPDFDFRCQLAELIADRSFLAEGNIPRSKDAFEAEVQLGRQRIGVAVQDTVRVVEPLFESYHEAQLALEKAANPNWQHATSDVAMQLAELLRPGFLTATPWSWLAQYPRYFRAISYRLERLSAGSLARDRQNTDEIRVRWDGYQERAQKHVEMDIFDPELAHYRWMLEEYRVSLFAQPLGTAVPVSAKRLDRQWAKTRGRA